MIKFAFRGVSRFSTVPPTPPPTPQMKIPLIKRIVPQKYHPYVDLGRYDKPIGYMLLFWPCAWGLSFSIPLPSIFDYFVFLAGSISMRAAGCIVNDISDKDFDKEVERTKERPLASGKLTKTQAGLFLIPNLTVGLLVLTQLTPMSIAAAFGILPVVVAYPLMKRYTNYPQVVLGLAFNWGTIVAYLARSEYFLPEVIIPAYLAGICWTLVYDTIYAFQDIKDDERIGVKSTARTWKYNFKEVMQKLIAVSGGLLMVSGIAAQMPLVYFPLILLTHFVYLKFMMKVDLNNRTDCGKAFKNSNFYGLAVALIIYICNEISQLNIEAEFNKLKGQITPTSQNIHPQLNQQQFFQQQLLQNKQ